jgi:hypothetical protein
VVVVLIPFTSSPYRTAAHPVGKSYAINIEAEKIAFSELSNIVVEHFYNWRATVFEGRIT